MSGRCWDTPDRVRELLCELVGWDSVTHTPGEAAFAGRLRDRLAATPWFSAHPDLLELGDAGHGRSFLTALYRAEGVADTVVLMSHFDTVAVTDYGQLEQHAHDPGALATAMARSPEQLDPETIADLRSGDWLFGRGTMDMKAGLAIHMALLERAAAERWEVNLLLLTVPDEEVNSAGMRAAAPHLLELAERNDLRYAMFLNGEPVFPGAQGDEARRVYSGSIGKIMPAALLYGRESHAGTPLAGLSSSFMATYLTQAMEWNPEFCEESHGERTPPPVTLDQRDRRDGYSTQTPFRSSVLYNVFLMERGAAEVLDTFVATATGAMARCEADYRAMCDREGTEPVGPIRVLTYEQLERHAAAALGATTFGELLDQAAAAEGVDARDRALLAAELLVGACPELTPAAVLLFAPPLYPAVNSSDDRLVQSCIARLREVAGREFGLEIEQTHYFNGISDLSYVSLRTPDEAWSTYERNTPGYGSHYSVPFAAMRALDAPVLNVGPFGKAPHKRTERVHLPSVTVEVPALLADLVQQLPSMLRPASPP